MSESNFATGVFFDLETSGLDHKKDKIIEVGIVVFLYNRHSNHIVATSECYSMLEDPGIPLTSLIEKLTGLNDFILRGQKIDWDKVKEVMMKADVIIAHNIDFDRKFILEKLPELSEKKFLCSLNGIDWKAKGHTSLRLGHLCYDHGFMNTDAHRALADATCGLRLIKPYFKELMEKEAWMIEAINAPFEKKDLLKKNDYYWRKSSDDKDKNCWQKRVDSKDKAEEEEEFLKKAIYPKKDEENYDYKIWKV